MSSSDETTVETESPLVIKSRPVPRKESSSESEENDSEPEGSANESEEEEEEEDKNDDTEEPDETEKSPQPVVPVVRVAPKPSSAPKAKLVPHNTVKPKITYDRMVHEAMERLNEIRRIGVSIQRILKYVNENYDVPSNRVKFYCKKAIDKGLKENIYVHTSGVGLQGSIAFSVEHWNDMMKEQKKILKAAERQEKSKAKAKAKPKPKTKKVEPKLTAAKKPKAAAKPKPKPKQKVEPEPTAAKKPKVDSKAKNSQPQKDTNNNPAVGKAEPKKTKRTLRLSINLPTTKAKPKPKGAPGAKTNKEKSSAETVGKAGPSTRGGREITTRSKSIDV